MNTYGNRVLCVDSEEQCEIITQLLKLLGDYDFTVSNIQSAEEVIKATERKSFDLYILETFLPGEMNGVDLCKRIREKDTETPILFYSGMSRPVDRSLALAAGANAYLVKPDGLDALNETVERLLNKTNEKSKRLADC